ncbi:HWE histidine kinase domain-containing protein [Rhodanobacter sp. L36]|uniref:HWE histidine kinase domain-containing protein n=1 Tax=Rhodanobacter sp. L36 TaxID=1747221 RepID=UPI00131E9A50|nr:HWE histidine kinase domain-containing protein [Rhodanobacter sp. L36]
MTGSSLTLTTCDREPIHLLGAIQSFGFLLTVSSDWRVGQASANLHEYLGLSPTEACGRLLSDVLTQDGVHAIRGALQSMASHDSVERLFGLVLKPGLAFDLAIHRSDQWIVIEGERSVAENPADAAQSTRTMIMRLQRAGTLLETCQEAARQVRALTGFDRVMIYRFDEDGSGEVIAERAQSVLEPYLGLHYPASDIPQQARALYLRNTLRIIADVDDAVSTIVSVAGVNTHPLDLSLSVLRAVSPIHLQYLRNMGVAASMSISIVQQGELWGLIVCHHGKPRQLSLGVRTTAELFGQMFSFLVENRQREMELAQERFTRAQHNRLIASLPGEGSVFDNLAAVASELRGMIECDGLAIIVDDRICATGRVPSDAAIRELGRFIDKTSPGASFSTDRLATIYPPSREFDSCAAGMLAMPISSVKRDYLIFFRDGWNHAREWAGDPGKPTLMNANDDAIGPRKSFAAWSELVEGHSRKWSAGDVRVVEQLRVSLLEVIFRASDSADRARQEAGTKRELLIAELNHRVRNILGLIRGLVAQSHDGVSHVEEFIETVSGRIQALARAHDQITAEQWSAAPLRSLIEAEANAYLLPGRDRLQMTGPDILLDPHAFSTIALVVHELMTNSAKYGAFSTPGGRVVIAWAIDENASMTLSWIEQGGPPVRAPTRRGFGSTIVERAIPFDLKGTAAVDYALGGLQANFVIPKAFFRLSDGVVAAVAAKRAAPLDHLQGEVLVLEDNMIIALDAEDILARLGASKVHSVSRVSEALQLIETQLLTFALLDFNLGDETSLVVALQLRSRGVPFMFATGYGEELRLPEELKHVRVITKPYSVESFRSADA